MKLRLFKYKYLPYEIKFLKNEIVKFGGEIVSENVGEIVVRDLSIENAKKLTYVQYIRVENEEILTDQSKREVINGKNLRTVQATRYGPHGIHDYKGKFNPQMPRSLILQNFSEGDKILDPFMGSGTTIIEARNLNMNAYGVELNPLAFTMASAKLKFEELKELPVFKLSNKVPKIDEFYESSDYLTKWFTEQQLNELAVILKSIERMRSPAESILSIVLSDQLRKNSMQDPRDLRIRRLKEYPADSTLMKDFISRYEHVVDVHKRWKKLNNRRMNAVHIFNGDSTSLGNYIKVKVDGSVCSPPYFSALPYIDTYRLSMVALGLILPSEIAKEERKLIGAREITTSDKKNELEYLDTLPDYVSSLVKDILRLLEKDKEAGFRKKAVPYNLIRYCRLMKDVLISLKSVENENAYNLWVVGPNKATINKQEIIIDTPKIIQELARHVGFSDCELEPVDAYSRFDLHSKNSIRHETVVKFRR